MTKQIITFKNDLTAERVKKVANSMRNIAIMSKIIEYEYLEHMDFMFKNPQINMFNKKIGEYARSIEKECKIQRVIKLQFENDDVVQDYAGEIHQFIQFFVNLPLEQLREVRQNLQNIPKIIEVD